VHPSKSINTTCFAQQWRQPKLVRADEGWRFAFLLQRIDAKGTMSHQSQEDQVFSLETWKQHPVVIWASQDGLVCYALPEERQHIGDVHQDDVYMLDFVCQGQVDLFVDGFWYPVPPRHLLWTSPCIPHAHRVSGCIETIFFVFSPALVQEVRQQIHPGYPVPQAAVIRVTDTLEGTVRLVLREAMNAHPQAYLLSLLLRVVLGQFFRLLTETEARTTSALAMPDLPRIDPLTPAIKEARGILQNEWSRGNLTLQEVAGRVGLSIFYFTRRFRTEIGISPGGYLRHQRLVSALHLLLDTSLSLKEIAFRCGFGSARHLADACKTTLGQSPAALRRTRAQQYIFPEPLAQKTGESEQENAL
jgi:AraC-like DNA-binding protein